MQDARVALARELIAREDQFVARSLQFATSTGRAEGSASNTDVAERMINPEDLDLIQIIDSPEEVVEAIFKHYENRGFLPLPEEHELLLNL